MEERRRDLHLSSGGEIFSSPLEERSPLLFDISIDILNRSEDGESGVAAEDVEADREDETGRLKYS